jgi:hypothetical protein
MKHPMDSARDTHENDYKNNDNLKDTQLFDKDFLRQETIDVNTQLREMLKEQDKFKKITEHVINEKRIKMSLLKKERISLNDVIKWAYCFLDDVIFTTYFEMITPDYDTNSILDEFDYWANYTQMSYADDLMTIAFSKHRLSKNGEVRQSIKNLAEWLGKHPFKVQEAMKKWDEFQHRSFETHLINKIMCAYKFDNKDRDLLKNSKFLANQQMKNFDFDKRRTVLANINPRKNFEFFSYFASLQTMILLAENCPYNQERLNELLRNKVIHYSEIMNISKTID